jgi:serine/threonine protein phosphatase PrpC
VSAESQCRSAFLSHPGAVRQVNEDSFFEAPDLGVWAVADGMGGHEAGQLASTMIVDALDAMSPGSDEALLARVRERLSEINRRLRDLAAERYAGRIVGSTVALLLLDATRAVCLWAGDSRIYRLRDGTFERLTRDHSRTEELIAAGHLDPADANAHPLAHLITRAVGAEERLALEMRDEPLAVGDRFLLCTDGLTRTLDDSELAALLTAGDCETAARALLAASLARQPRDNVTLGIVDVPDAAASDETVRLFR